MPVKSPARLAPARRHRGPVLRRRQPTCEPNGSRPSPLEAAFVDAAIESYVEWREESMRVESAYACWRNALACERALGLRRGAGPRGARACEVHARLIRWLSGSYDERRR